MMVQVRAQRLSEAGGQGSHSESVTEISFSLPSQEGQVRQGLSTTGHHPGDTAWAEYCCPHWGSLLGSKVPQDRVTLVFLTTNMEP